MLTLILFGLLAVFAAGDWPENRWLLKVATGLFVVAALSDALDGYLARRWNQVTQLGRVLDPFADKLLIIGTFVFLCSALPAGAEPSEFVVASPLVVIVVIARELFVSVLRAACEAQGVDFSADAWGKIKMVVQVVALTLALAVPAFSWLDGWQGVARGILWLTAGVTLMSSLTYWQRAWPILREGKSA